MTSPLTSLNHWDCASTAAREIVAHDVQDHRPEFHFLGLWRHAHGSQRHEIAHYDYGGVDFALIPACDADLGWDPATPWIPNEEELAEWESFWGRRPGEPAPPLETYVAEHLTQRRHVATGPFLLEVSARRMGVSVLGPGDPLFDERAAAHLLPGVGGLELPTGHGWITYRLDDDQSLLAELARPVAHAAVERELADQGFRLPSSDEWEHACAAGSRTLFRWGDHCPPGALRKTPSKLRGVNLWRMWTDPALLAQFKEEQSHSLYRDSHANPCLAPNAFGLHMNGSDFVFELCAEPLVVRGGDQGRGALTRDQFTGMWLPWASAFFTRRTEREAMEPHYGTVARRLLPLARKKGNSVGWH